MAILFRIKLDLPIYIFFKHYLHVAPSIPPYVNVVLGDQCIALT